MQAPPLHSAHVYKRKPRRTSTSPGYSPSSLSFTPSMQASLSIYVVAQEQVERLVMRARAGECVREETLLALQPVIVALARRSMAFLQQRNQVTAETDDLLQSANIALLMALDTALTMDDPYLYLIQVARYTLSDYTRGYADTYSQCEAISTISLDKPLNEDGTTLSDLLAAPDELATQDESEHEAKRKQQYRLLYQAIASLSEKQRLVIERHYGLTGHPESLNALNGVFSRKSMVAYYHHRKALAHLRSLLASVFPEFVDDNVPAFPL